MSWISLVCLLALSSSALARSSYGSGYGTFTPPPMNPLPPVASYGSQKTVLPAKINVGLPSPLPRVISGYGAQVPPMDLTTIKPPTNYGSQIVPTFSTPIIKMNSGYGAQTLPSFEIPVPQKTEILPIVKPVESYGTPQLPPQRTVPSYGSHTPSLLPSLPRTMPSYGSIPEPVIPRPFNEIIPKTLSEADILCRGKAPESVILLDGGRRYVFCTADGKGDEMRCQNGLYYSLETRRCDYKPGTFPDLCLSQPCLNGGQCTSYGYKFECTCPAGFEGRFCELDARVCQTQQPCGQSPDARCQSFRFGAALSHCCIFQGGLAYGFSVGQTAPNPCNGVDATFPLAFSNRGFIMCDGDRLSIESCPGGTVWDDINKACSWPDMDDNRALVVPDVRPSGYSSGYSAEPIRSLTPISLPKSGY